MITMKGHIQGKPGRPILVLFLILAIALLGLALMLATVRVDALGFVSPALAPSTTAELSLEPNAPAIMVGETITVSVVVTGVTDLYGVDLSLSFDPAVATVVVAGGQTTISLLAPDGKIPVDTEIIVTVRISDVVDLYAFALTIDYPVDKLQVVDADPVFAGIQSDPADVPNPILPLGLVIQNQADNNVGTLSYVITQLAPTPPVNGSCDVLHIRFLTVDGPDANLHFGSVKLSNIHGADIPVTLIDRQLILEKAGEAIYLPFIISD
jgi:hypothetical protein